jgi:hypothetical protein
MCCSVSVISHAAFERCLEHIPVAQIDALKKAIGR